MAILIGHRGAKASCPENTLQGIRFAAACGVNAVEMDVRLSKDGTLVLMHDQAVDRTTNGTGRVEDISLVDLKKLDAGGEPVPTLREAVELTCELGISAVVEMKEEGLEELVTEAVDGAQVLITSFYHHSLREIKAISRLKTGIIISSLPLYPVDLALWAEADAIFPKRVNANLIRKAHQRRIEVYPWTINDRKSAEWLIKLGSDGIVTDDPCLLKGVLDQPVRDTTKENCEYYPCHFPGQDCSHCFCPLYPCRDPELGRFVRTKRGKRFWTCIDCHLVHKPEVAEYLSDNPQATTKDLKSLNPDH
jgi:glycerophosphoryl diester phosphodiesterase